MNIVLVRLQNETIIKEYLQYIFQYFLSSVVKILKISVDRGKVISTLHIKLNIEYHIYLSVILFYVPTHAPMNDLCGGH